LQAIAIIATKRGCFIKRLPVNVKEDQYKLLTEIAGQEKRSLSGQLAKILDDWLQQYQRDRTKGAKSK